MDLSFLKLIKHYTFKLSRVQSHATFLSACLNLKIPPNGLTVRLPAIHSPPSFQTSLSAICYTLSMEMTRAFQLEYFFPFFPRLAPFACHFAGLSPPHPVPSCHSPFGPAGSRPLLCHPPAEAFWPLCQFPLGGVAPSHSTHYPPLLAPTPFCRPSLPSLYFWAFHTPSHSSYPPPQISTPLCQHRFQSHLLGR